MSVIVSDDLEQLAKEACASLDVSLATRRTYLEALKSFFAWRRRIASPAATEPDIETRTLQAYKAWLQAGHSSNTLSTYLVALRRCFAALVAQGHLPANPAQAIKGPRRPRGHLRSDLSRQELRALLEAIKRDSPLGRRDFAMINLMVRGGLRLVEVQRTNVDDIEEQQGRRILRIWGKGRATRDEFVVLTEPTERAIAAYLETRGPLPASAPLFAGLGGSNWGRRLSRRTIRRRVTYYLEQTGVKRPRVSAHSLRHSFVTLAIEGGASILQAQTAARHRSIQTTLVYFHEHARLSDPVEDKIHI